MSSWSYAASSYLAPYLKKQPAIFREVPLGVDDKFFHPAKRPVDLAEEYSLGAEDKAALFVGSLDRAHYFKGIDVLLKAWIEVLRSCPRAKLIIIGEGDLRPIYAARARHLGLTESVCFVGRISEDELPKYYQLSDLLVLPSTDRSEAFGLVCLEAMASGRPVVASRLPGVLSVVRHGETGLLVPPSDADSLARSITNLFHNTDLSQKFGVKARQLVEENYADDLIADKLIKVLGEKINL